MGKVKKEKVTMDIPAVRAIANYAHWIPALNGFRQQFFTENYPDWEWNDFVPKLIKKGILVYQSEDPSNIKLSQGLSISRNVKAIEFLPTATGIKIKIINRS